LVGGSFYQLPRCDICSSGYLPTGLGCQLADVEPLLTASSTSLKVAQGLPSQTEIATFAAELQSGVPLTLSWSITKVVSLLTEKDTLVSIHPATGHLHAAVALDVIGQLLVTVRVTDNRTTCRTLTQAYPGGCFAEAVLDLQVVGFPSCPANIVYYLSAAETQATLAWEVPVLPPSVTGVQVQGPDQRVFEGGDYEMVYTTSALDLGQAPVCRFTISVLRGFNYVATVINHQAFLSSKRVYDFVMEQFPAVLGQLAAPSFTINGEITGADFAIGIRSAPKRPFTLNGPAGVESRIKVDMAWCVPGAQLDGRALLPLPVRVELSGVAAAFRDQGSGAHMPVALPPLLLALHRNPWL
jgi:hypothetical protein